MVLITKFFIDVLHGTVPVPGDPFFGDIRADLENAGSFDVVKHPQLNFFLFTFKKLSPPMFKALCGVPSIVETIVTTARIADVGSRSSTAVTQQLVGTFTSKVRLVLELHAREVHWRFLRNVFRFRL